MKIELEYLEKLVSLVKENGLTELTLEEGEKAIVIKKEGTVVTQQVSAPFMHAAMPAQAVAPAAA
ncbi:MAG TPA: acetyl-CoA carboxylase biotin carboxyl carrier protein, partial [Cyanobacteria bacterium UBA9579]|nr:acetyl-CoA carboxylase biotin carboxyl carrier protein [Cyanobacteria bacterium UBA9579]